MKIQFCGATRTVTGSCYYLEASGRKLQSKQKSTIFQVYQDMQI